MAIFTTAFTGTSTMSFQPRSAPVGALPLTEMIWNGTSCRWKECSTAACWLTVNDGDQVWPSAKASCGPPSSLAGTCAPWKCTVLSAPKAVGDVESDGFAVSPLHGRAEEQAVEAVG